MRIGGLCLSVRSSGLVKAALCERAGASVSKSNDKRVSEGRNFEREAG